MGCSSSQQLEPPPLATALKEPASYNSSVPKWRETEFSKDKWTPVEKLLNLPAENEVKGKLKAWCKTNTEAKSFKLLEIVECVDEIAKRRAVFQAGQRCGDSLETGQEVLEANAKSIVIKYLKDGGSKYLGDAVGGDWEDKEILAKLNLVNTTEFDGLGMRLVVCFQEAVDKM